MGTQLFCSCKIFNDEFALHSMTSKDDLAAIVEKAKNATKALEDVSSWTKTFQFDVTDGDPYYVEIDKGAVALKEGKSDSPTATISATDSLLSDLFTEKVNAVQAFMGGKLKVSGDVFSVQKLTSIISKVRK